jgi:hypothetical protein
MRMRRNSGPLSFRSRNAVTPAEPIWDQRAVSAAASVAQQRSGGGCQAAVADRNGTVLSPSIDNGHALMRSMRRRRH